MGNQKIVEERILPIEELLKESEKRLSILSRGITEIPDGLGKKLIDLKEYIFLPKGNYIVPYDMAINPEGVLRIEAGTWMFFEKKCGILDFGTLLAKQVTFTAYNPKERWRNITFIGESSDLSLLDHCSITFGSGRNEIPEIGEFKAHPLHDYYGGAILFYYSNAKVLNCEVRFNEADKGGGVHSEGLAPVLEDTSIAWNYARLDGAGISVFNKSDSKLLNKLAEKNTLQNNLVEVGKDLYLKI